MSKGQRFEFLGDANCFARTTKIDFRYRCRSAELLPKSVLIGYAQSGKCNERQASNYADSSVFIRSHNQTVTDQSSSTQDTHDQSISILSFELTVAYAINRIF